MVCEKSIYYGDDEPQVDFKLGICYFHLGEFKKSEEHLLKVVLVNPDFLDPYLFLGDIYFNQKKYAQEGQVLEKARNLFQKANSHVIY